MNPNSIHYDDEMANTVTIADIIAAFRDATATEMADLLCEMDRGMSIWSARQEKGTPMKPIAAPAEKPKRGRPPKKAVSPAPVATASATEATAQEAPTAESYRIDPTTIVADRCQARRLGPDGGDKRWYPAVYHEAQCEKKPADGSNLCATCQRRKAACEAALQSGAKIRSNSTAGHWNGLITEAVPAWSHMLDSVWAAEAKPVWHGPAATETAQTAQTAQTTETDATGTTKEADPEPPKKKTVKRRAKAATAEPTETTTETTQTVETTDA